MNALHLLWIIPLTLYIGATVGFFFAAVCAAASKEDDNNANLN